LSIIQEQRKIMGKSRGKAAGKQRSGRAAAAQSEKYQEKPLHSMAFVSLPKQGGVCIEMVWLNIGNG